MKLSAEEKAERDDLNYDSRGTYYLYNHGTKEIEKAVTMGYAEARRNNNILDLKSWLTRQELSEVELTPSPVKLIYIFKNDETGDITTLTRPLDSVHETSSLTHSWFHMFSNNNTLITVVKES